MNNAFKNSFDSSSNLMNNLAQLLNNNIPSMNNFNNQNNLVDYLSRSISNNILQSLLNNNNNNIQKAPSNFPFNFEQKTIYNNNNNPNSKDIFKIEKLPKKNFLKPSKGKDSINNKERIQNSLQRRKDNINQFLMNYRLKNQKNNQTDINNPLLNNEEFNKNIKNMDNNKDSKSISSIKEINNNMNKKKGIIDINKKNEKLIKNNNISEIQKTEKMQLKVTNMNNKELGNNIKENEKEINNDNIIFEDELPNQDIFSNQNNESNKEELKRLFIEEIFYQKNIADNYEIPFKFFKEVEMPP